MSDAELGRLDEIPGLTDLPLICTLRWAADGGRWRGSEEERHRLLYRAATAGYAYIDLESDVFFADVEDLCEGSGVRVIRSLHDLRGVPDNLTELVRGLPRKAREIAKAAVTPRSTRDLLEIVAAFERLRDLEKIVIGMGPWGFCTRILAGKLGSTLTFCSPKDMCAAPGHIDPATLRNVYRFKSISPSTKVYCVIANPVMHTRSPWIHNPAFEEVAMDAVYVPIQVDDLETFFELASRLDINGVSVTVPHKSGVRDYLVMEDDVVRGIGSCNTLYLREKGFYGSNTDVDGFMAPLYRYVAKEEIGDMAVTVVGSGGTSRAAVYALRRLGAAVCILNRTPARAEALAGEFGCSWAPLGPESADILRDHSDLIVQTTSAGMHPNEHLDPLEFYDFAGSEIVYDVIYSPPETRLLARAKMADCVTLNGESMLLEQAYRQFFLFTGIEYPETCRDVPVFDS